jgi:hypothetical protein
MGSSQCQDPWRLIPLFELLNFRRAAPYNSIGNWPRGPTRAVFGKGTPMIPKWMIHRVLAFVLMASLLTMPRIAGAQSGVSSQGAAGQPVGMTPSVQATPIGTPINRPINVHPGSAGGWGSAAYGSASYDGRGSVPAWGDGTAQSRGPGAARPDAAADARSDDYRAGPPVKGVYPPDVPAGAEIGASSAASQSTNSGQSASRPTGTQPGAGRSGAPGRDLPGSESGVPARPFSPPRKDVDEGSYIYTEGNTVVIPGAPALLGGYYYANYCDTTSGQYVYPSVYSTYDGGPQFIYNPGVIVVSQPQYPVYNTPYAAFDAPPYQVNYNETNYYVTEEDQAAQIQEGGAPAKKAIKQAYSDGTYQAAFADIERAWTDGDAGLIRKHLRDPDTKISVLMKRKYSYSIASDDFADITRDAIERLDTISFKFTRLRKADDGDVTAYGVHVYRAAKSDDTSDDESTTDKTVPFDADAPADTSTAATDASSHPATAGDGSAVALETSDSDTNASTGSKAVKTIYVSYTLRKGDDQWYIVLVDSSPNKLAPDQDDVK